jgi:DNA-binding beta-propeller fold protein YncE
MSANTMSKALQGSGASPGDSGRRAGRWQSLIKFVGSLALVAAFVPLTACSDSDAADGDPTGAPKFAVDPSWPKQLPNKWIIGQVAGVAVDRDDNIWVLHRPRSNTADELGAAQEPPRSECCLPAPPVLKFDPEGNVLASWGGEGQGYNWPTVEHGIWADDAGNIWIGGNGATDRQILKFSSEGQFLLQIGRPSSDPLDSTRTDILGQVASITVDDEANEVYMADGYGNKRVIVYDSENGQFKRLWGAYGNVPNDANPGPYDPAAPIAQQFRNPVHCVRISNDGFVYVCDRVNNRVQVFTKAGEYVKEFFVRPETRGNGSTWDLSFSKDAAQRFVVIIDGENNVIWTVDRDSGAVVDKQASRGRNAGQFHWVHQFGTDSQGNIYTGEVDTSKRLQKFVLQGS